MRILVTGGAGFIGSNLCKRLLSDEHEVVVLDNLIRGNKLDKEDLENLEFVKGDIQDFETVLKCSKACDAIFHLAAILGVDIVADNPIETMDVEVIGMRNISNAAIQNSVGKILYASTSGIYGHSAIEQAVSEDIMVDPRTSYALAKRFNEVYLAALWEEKKVSSVSLRFFNVYGYKQDNRMVIPRFFEQAIAGEDLTVFGSGNQTRDFTFIDDVVESCCNLLHCDLGNEIFNISNEHETTIEELARTIIKITNSKSKIRFINAPKKRYDFEVERRVGSSKKLFDTTGYKPTTLLEEGLRKTFDLS